MARYTNTKEISEAFIRDGWSENTSFSEVTLDEAKEEGLYFAVEAIKKRQKNFPHEYFWKYFQRFRKTAYVSHSG